MYCQDCGTKKVNGSCSSCAAKSVNGVDFESLDSALNLLEKSASNFSKGVRPAEAKIEDEDDRDPEEVAEDALEQSKEYGNRGEGDSEEEPKTERGIEKEAKKGAFEPDDDFDDDDEDDEPRRKKDDFDDDDFDDEEPEFKSASKKKKGKKAKKSFADTARENSTTIQKAMDVSPFLKDLVEQVSDANDELRSDITKSYRLMKNQKEFNYALAKSVAELGKLLKGLAGTVNQITKEPVSSRKSDVSVIEKSFAGSTKNGTQLTKSEISAKMLSLMESGDKSITPADVVRADTDGFVRPELRSKLGIGE